MRQSDVFPGTVPFATTFDDDSLSTARRPAIRISQSEDLAAPTDRTARPWFDAGDAGDSMNELTAPLLAAIEPPRPTAHTLVSAGAPAGCGPIAPRPAPTLRPLARTVAPPAPSALPALAGLGLATIGAAVAVGILGWKLVQQPGPALGRGLSPMPPATSRVTAPAVSTQRPASAAATTCRELALARRVAPLIVPGSPLHVASAGQDVAVGALTSGRTGIGLVLAPSDLSERSKRFVADGEHVSGVVPSADGFVADRWTQTLPGTTEFSVGMTPTGFARIGSNAEQTAIWPGEARAAITRPAIAHAPGSGYAIAFRRGDGDVRVGWVDEQGSSKSELSAISPGTQRASAPSIAVGERELLVAFAVRTDEGWQIQLGKSAIGRTPTEVRRFAVPAGGPGTDLREPSVAALAGGRWLLAWVQGPGQDARLLRAQVLSDALAPVGAPIAIASIPGSLPSLALWSEAGRAVVLYTLDAGRQRGELWAASFDCGA